MYLGLLLFLGMTKTNTKILIVTIRYNPTVYVLTSNLKPITGKRIAYIDEKNKIRDKLKIQRTLIIARAWRTSEL